MAVASYYYGIEFHAYTGSALSHYLVVLCMQSNVMMWYTNFCHDHTARCSDMPVLTHENIIYTPPRDVSGTLSRSKRYTGTIATYSCSPGYQLVGGSSLRACGPDGTWNGTRPSCSKYVKGDSYVEIGEKQ